MIPTPAKRRHQPSAPDEEEKSARLGAAMGEEEGADEEEDEGAGLLFNGLACGARLACGRLANHHEEADADEGEDDLLDEDDELEYLRLDTIVEEDENSWLESGESHLCDSRGAPEQTTQANSNNSNNNNTNQRPQAEKSESDNNYYDNHASLRSNSALANSMRKFSSAPSDGADKTNKQQKCDKAKPESDDDAGCEPSDDEEAERPANSNKANRQQQQEAAKCAKMQQQQQLPSTNRLISEHQARQQQALFRALAERQKLLDELGQEEPLMSARTLTRRPNKQPQQQQQQRRRRHRRSSTGDAQAPNQEQGVPLSAVDLSSMSDRMLDELLGHIASASSSSLSSNGESLDSSDLSSGGRHAHAASSGDESAGPADEEAPEGDGAPPASLRSRGGLAKQQLSRLLLANDAPNVVGVHEDERSALRGPDALRAGFNCRQAHRRGRNDERGDDDHDRDQDDDNHDHELVVHLGHAADQWNEPDSSLSPAAGGRRSMEPAQGEEQLGLPQAPANSKLEEYFTSRLVQARDFARTPEGSESAANELYRGASPTGAERAPAGEPPTKPAPAGSVEEVLARMLEALNEIGPDEGEELNELLERGFAHLEQLLNCSLGSASAHQLGPRHAPSQPAIPSVNHAISSQQQQQQQQLVHQPSALSKDSDYGSDTQSADCFSHYNAPGADKLAGSQQQAPAAPSASPSPTSLTASNAASSMGQQSNPSALSALAIELSFKLAESLHRLAQQQAARSKAAANTPPEAERPAVDTPSPASAQPATPRRTPMKSVVVIKAARSPSSASSAAPTTASSTTPSETPTRNPTPETRPQFKTRVSIGGSTQQASKRAEESTGEQVEQSKQQPQPAEDLKSNTKRSLKSEPEAEATQPATGEPSVAASTVCVNFERRRSARSSLRRRPSFSGSLGGGQREPRPGSPAPRPPMAPERAASSEQAEEAKAKQRQLQRALILAQKYNYSPAKLAASKLSAKLQLTQATTSAGREDEADGEQFVRSSAAGANGANQEQQLAARRQHKQEARNWSTATKANQRHQVQVSGQVQLDVSYFAKSGSLTLHLLQCAQLAPVSKRRTTSNPYVKIYLLPDKSKSGKRKSAVIRNELNPKFDEKFTFGPLQLAEFEAKILWLSVWHRDRLGRNEFLGELLLPLAQVKQQLLSSDLCQSTAARWYELRPRFDAASASINEAGRRQQPQDAATSNSALANGSLTLPASHRLARFESTPAAPPSVELVNKLNELQRKADLLTTAVAPSGGLQPRAAWRTPAEVSQTEGADRISGQLFVALKFVPDDADLMMPASRLAANKLEGALHVIIKEAHQIGGFEAPQVAALAGRQPPCGPLPNPFCKCYLLDAFGQRVAKQKTAHLKRTANPRWDHECVFSSLKLAQLGQQAIEILMFNRDSILVSNNQFLGAIRLCCAPDSSEPSQQTNEAKQAPSSEQREARLWSQMLQRPNIWVYGELKLRQL